MNTDDNSIAWQMVDFLKFPGNLAHLKCIILLNAFWLFCSFGADAQTPRKVSGTVIDSLKDIVSGADVFMIADKDTLTTVTDNRGRFSFGGIQTDNISILIMRVGFKPYTMSYQYREDQLNLFLYSIMLHQEANLLDEVIIKARDKPIRIKADTVEYNASFYQINENDRVEDLLRQLPGVEVDANGNAFTMGKPLQKLRVNGEDFFTNNVKDFIRQLPAGMIDKLQIINDYGDEANFTGMKNGDSQKMLNLVTKAGQNNGKFGNIAASGGTDHRYGLQGNGNFWEGSKQIGLNSNSNNTSNDAGINTNAGAGLNYRDKLSSGITASAVYNYAYIKNLSSLDNSIETVNPGGTIFNKMNSDSRSTDNNNTINFNIQSIADKSYFQASLGGSMVKRNRDANTISNQTGLIMQDLLSNTLSNSETPNLNGNFVWARSMQKLGRSMSGGVTLSTGINQVEDDLGNRISYYSQDKDVLLKDSLVKRFVETENRTNNVSADFRYSEPLRASLDSAVKQNIDFAYFFSFNKTRNSLYTRVNNSIGNNTVVDSLSSLYSSSFILHRFAVSYRYQSKKLNYSLGVTAQPSQLTGQYEGNETRIDHVELNVSPIVNLNYALSDWDNLAFVYGGASTAPDFYQLQPVPNITNLQNVIIGNPNLRSSFTHSGNLSFQHTDEDNGATLMLAMNGSVVEDQVVSNVVLVKDTLNSLKQQTHFENANGAYQFGSTYSYAVPFSKNKFNLELRGTWDYINMVSFANNVLNNNKNINFSQSLKLRMNERRLTLSSYATYNYSSNRYSIALLDLRNIETWQFNVNGRLNVGKSWVVSTDMSKRVNSGYTIDVADPLLLNFALEKTMFKSRQATVTLQAYDLLNQGNNLVRSISDNSITDSRYNQITRYFLLSFNYRLQKFGRK
ncbi:CarboxypepD_reg-like domain-containing protein [Pedobacter hartonius]|uniref:CarboxypepD_reg-like domain-containing protein n=1 Tax=Pedobacter hartonius TaxID=425514 RepID=A0A1H4GUU0_9SPHI|nr:CarboxypepD_reg-like domain-containing protein [Pedobacter hartonius]